MYDIYLQRGPLYLSIHLSIHLSIYPISLVDVYVCICDAAHAEGSVERLAGRVARVALVRRGGAACREAPPPPSSRRDEGRASRRSRESAVLRLRS